MQTNRPGTDRHHRAGGAPRDGRVQVTGSGVRAIVWAMLWVWTPGVWRQDRALSSLSGHRNEARPGVQRDTPNRVTATPG